MSHFDAVTEAPAGFIATASTPRCARRRARGRRPADLGRAVPPRGRPHAARHGACCAASCTSWPACPPTWTMASIIDEQVERDPRARSATAGSICALSRRRRLGGRGGARAPGDRPPADVRLRRHRADAQGRERAGRRDVPAQHGHRADPRRRRRAVLRARSPGVTDPEAKRKTIGELFIRIFEENTGGLTDAEFLVQGTLYPDVIESGGTDGTAAVIKSHHNVGGLPEDMTLELDRAAARAVQGRGAPARPRARPARRDRLAPAVPGPGARRADHRRGDAGARSRCCRRPTPSCARRSPPPGSSARSGRRSPCSPTSARSGVMGDERTYGHPIIIRAVTSDDAMTADWARLPYDLLETDVEPHHQRGRRHQPGRLRHHVEAPRHDRVGVSERASM